jgi:undecaprenyl-phosphate galactose phosphotransferase
MGKDGVPFPCIKFRTMVPGAEAVLELMLAEDAGLRVECVKYHKLRVDPRVTRVGRFLRGPAWMSCLSYGTSCAGR